jgi:hypothetical protein
MWFVNWSSNSVEKENQFIKQCLLYSAVIWPEKLLTEPQIKIKNKYMKGQNKDAFI